MCVVEPTIVRQMKLLRQRRPANFPATCEWVSYCSGSAPPSKHASGGRLASAAVMCLPQTWLSLSLSVAVHWEQICLNFPTWFSDLSAHLQTFHSSGDFCRRWKVGSRSEKSVCVSDLLVLLRCSVAAQLRLAFTAVKCCRSCCVTFCYANVAARVLDTHRRSHTHSHFGEKKERNLAKARREYLVEWVDDEKRGGGGRPARSPSEVTWRQVPLSSVIRMKNDPPVDDEPQRSTNGGIITNARQPAVNHEFGGEKRNSCSRTSIGVATPIRQRKRKKKKMEVMIVPVLATHTHTQRKCFISHYYNIFLQSAASPCTLCLAVTFDLLGWADSGASWIYKKQKADLLIH